MNGILIDSSFIYSVDYIKEEETLKITFVNGTEYEYQGINEELFEDFLKAESKGRFFRENIRNKFLFNA